MTSPFKEGQAISHADVVRWERQLHEQRLLAAIAQARDGESNWESLTHGMGRNELPDVLCFTWERLPHNQLLIAVGAAWAASEVPEKYLTRRDWLAIFGAAGYHDDDKAATPPDAITLWRGGVKKTRMAWSADRERAEWFQHRFDHLGTPGKLWTITVGPDRLLAHYHHSQRHEDELRDRPDRDPTEGNSVSVALPVALHTPSGYERGSSRFLGNRLSPARTSVGLTGFEPATT
jgi:hypothetical protein